LGVGCRERREDGPVARGGGTATSDQKRDENEWGIS
jgi:hypothetical protein